MTEMDLIENMLREASGMLMSRFGAVTEITQKADSSLVTDADLACDRMICGQILEYFPNDQILTEESGAVGGARDPKQFMWIIDPLDGTTNYAHGYPFFSVSIARGRYSESGQFEVHSAGIVDPVRDMYYLAQLGAGSFRNGKSIKVAEKVPLKDAFLVTGFYYRKGLELHEDMVIFEEISNACHAVRRDGSAALDLAMVASGVFHGFWERGLQSWDVAAGSLIVQEAGGTVCNYRQPFNQQGFDVFGKGLVAGGAGLVREMMDKAKFADS